MLRRFVSLSGGLRAVAIFEAAKGAVVLVAGFELLSLMHHDAQRLAERVVVHLHLNPASGYPRIFIDAMTHVTDARLWIFAVLALAYVGLRWIEAIGLWLEKAWAEWFAVASSGIYLPVEVYEMFRGVNGIKLLLLLGNLCIVAYLTYVLLQSERGRSRPPDRQNGS